MARSLVVPGAGETLVRVPSFSDKVLTLETALPVAEYHTVGGVSGTATPPEICGSPSAHNHRFCLLIDRNIEDD